MNMGKVATFGLEDAARLAGLQPTMVEYLCRTEIIRPSVSKPRGRGRRREYSFGDVVMLRAVAKLLKSGISVRALRGALSQLRKFHPEITPKTLPGAFLVTDGKKIYFREGPQVILELSKGQLSFAFLLELTNLQKEVAQRLVSPRFEKRARVAGG